ncbi:hypothetical protein WDV93_25780 [Pantoea ananatis]
MRTDGANADVSDGHYYPGAPLNPRGVLCFTEIAGSNIDLASVPSSKLRR